MTTSDRFDYADLATFALVPNWTSWTRTQHADTGGQQSP